MWPDEHAMPAAAQPDAGSRIRLIAMPPAETGFSEIVPCTDRNRRRPGPLSARRGRGRRGRRRSTMQYCNVKDFKPRSREEHRMGLSIVATPSGCPLPQHPAVPPSWRARHGEF
jgi:hypothetical protein